MARNTRRFGQLSWFPPADLLAPLPPEWVLRELVDADLDDDAAVVELLERRGVITSPYFDRAYVPQDLHERLAPPPDMAEQRRDDWWEGRNDGTVEDARWWLKTAVRWRARGPTFRLERTLCRRGMPKASSRLPKMTSGHSSRWLLMPACVRSEPGQSSNATLRDNTLCLARRGRPLFRGVSSGVQSHRERRVGAGVREVRSNLCPPDRRFYPRQIPGVRA